MTLLEKGRKAADGTMAVCVCCPWRSFLGSWFVVLGSPGTLS